MMAFHNRSAGKKQRTVRAGQGTVIAYPDEDSPLTGWNARPDLRLGRSTSKLAFGLTWEVATSRTLPLAKTGTRAFHRSSLRDHHPGKPAPCHQL